MNEQWATTQMSLQDVMLGEESQTQRIHVFVFIHVTSGVGEAGGGLAQWQEEHSAVTETPLFSWEVAAQVDTTAKSTEWHTSDLCILLHVNCLSKKIHPFFPKCFSCGTRKNQVRFWPHHFFSVRATLAKFLHSSAPGGPYFQETLRAPTSQDYHED